MNNYENEQLNANDFLGTYLVKEDIQGETLVTLIEVRAESIRDAARRKLVAVFQEFEKPLVLNSTNIKRLCKVFGSTNAREWRGRILLYVDENVEYAGKTIGGIRLRPANGNGRAGQGQSVAQTAGAVDDINF